MSLSKEGYITQTQITHTPNLIAIKLNLLHKKNGKLAASEANEVYHKGLEKQSLSRIAKMKSRGEESNQWQGHQPRFSQHWPSTRESDTFRVHHVNLNGLSIHDGYSIDLYLQGTVALQVDMGSMNEINLNLQNPSIRSRFTNAFKRFDRNMGIQQSYPPEPSMRKDDYNPGSNMIWVQGGYAGRIIERGKDKYGRWSYLVLLGKRNRKLLFISAYKVCKGGTLGGSGIAAQETRAMAKDLHPLSKNPRKAFDADLKEFVVTRRAAGYFISLTMDSNTDINSPEMANFMSDTGLLSPFHYLHPDTEPPATYYRGTTCIDIALVCPFMLQGVTRVGYAPFYYSGNQDHRELLVDFSEKFLFEFQPDPTKKLRVPLTMQNVQAVEKYIQLVKQFWHIAKLPEQVRDIHQKFETANPVERAKLIKRIITLDNVRIETMRAAAKRCGPSYANNFLWSPSLKKFGTIMRYWNHRRTAALEGDPAGERVTKPEGIEVEEATSEEGVMEAHIRATKNWTSTKAQATDLHLAHVDELIQRTADERGISYESARKHIYNVEVSKAKHQKHELYMKGPRTGLPKMVKVPVPNSEIPDQWMDITEEGMVNDILLQRTKHSLLASANSPFALGPLADLVGEDAEKEAADSIIEGTFDMRIIEGMNIPDKAETVAFLSALLRPSSKNGEPMIDCESDISTADYMLIFSKTPDKTACGPSGITMSHWKAACYDPDIAAIHAIFMDMPFRYGFSFPRWQRSIHVLLQKLDQPYANSFRNIQLYEGDFNGALKLLLGRRLMRHADEHQINSDETYGGRKGRNCHELLSRLQYTSEYSRIMRTPMGLLDVDAKGCFDRMQGNVTAMTNRRLGCKAQTAQCQSITIHAMKHNVKTGYGISPESIQRSTKDRLGGQGQGNGGGITNWHGHNETLLLAFKTFFAGCTISDPVQSIAAVQQWILSFVDDNKILFSFDQTATCEAILLECQRGLQTWDTLLKITGGAVEIRKCMLSLMLYRFDTYHFRNSRPGEPKMRSVNDTPGQCSVQPTNMPHAIPIQRQDPSTGGRLLGVRMAPDGSFTNEFQYRLQLVRDMAMKLAAAPFDTGDVLTVYQVRYKPAINFCLPITTFSAKQCDAIQCPFYKVMLPKLGINRNMKRDVIYGPYELGGLNLTDLKVEQLAQHVHRLIGNVRKRGNLGNIILMTFNAYQLHIGTAQPFLSQDPHLFPHRLPRDTSCITFIWEELRAIQGHIQIPELWRPPKSNVNDEAIIDAVLRTIQAKTPQLVKDTIWMVNACRLYLNVTMLSEIMDANGAYIQQWAMNGTQQNETAMDYPYQPKPPPRAWKIWRDALHATYLDIHRTADSCPLHRPIGPTSRNNITQPHWPPQIPTTGMTMRALIDLLPPAYSHAVGNVSIPPDDGLALAHALMSKNMIHAWSDGTVKNGEAAHAYTLRTIRDDPTESIVGSSRTPGDPKSICSLRTEHYGAFGIALLVQILCIRHSITATEGHLNFYIDNDTVIKRLKYGIQPEMGSIKYCKTDYDIWAETIHILESLPCTSAFTHVKGHQDDALYAFCKVTSPLPRLAHYNIEMDRIAGQCRNEGIQPMMTTVLPRSEIALVLNSNVVTHNVKDAISHAMKYEPVQTYLCQRNEWAPETFNLIDWQSFGRYMKSIPMVKRIKVSKYVHDWQNTGSQKEKFARSTHRKEPLEETEYQELSQCPMKCGEHEGPQHYLHCRMNPKPDEIKRCIQSIARWMQKAGTSKPLMIIILKAMREWLNEGILEIEWEYPEDLDHEGCTQALAEQQLIGWNNFFKGRISKTWTEIQQREYSRQSQHRIDSKVEPLPKHYSGNWWAANLIKQVVFMSLNLWQIRNDALHSDKILNDYNEQRRILLTQLATWYDKENDFEPEDKKYFHRPYLERQTDPNYAIQAWCISIERIHTMNERIRETTNARDIRNFFT